MNPVHDCSGIAFNFLLRSVLQLPDCYSCYLRTSFALVLLLKLLLLLKIGRVMKIDEFEEV